MSVEKVTINPEDLRDSDGTLFSTLQFWSCWNGPVIYNPWQSMYFALLREYGMVDEECPAGENMSSKRAIAL